MLYNAKYFYLNHPYGVKKILKSLKPNIYTDMHWIIIRNQIIF